MENKCFLILRQGDALPCVLLGVAAKPLKQPYLLTGQNDPSHLFLVGGAVLMKLQFHAKALVE